jgi:glycosyltransferase involved in cell wall biosynthesis
MSVIVTVRNEEETIEDCILSLINQSLPHNFYEVVVVDGDSKDKTTELVQKMSLNSPVKISLIQQEGRGISCARNTGIKYSQGQILVFIDGDAFAHHTWLEEYLKCFNTSDNTVGFIWGPIKVWNDNSKIANLLYQFYYSKIGAHGVNIAFKKTALEAVGSFDECFIGRNDDNVVILKLSKKGYKSTKCDLAIVSHNLPTSINQFLKLELYDGYYKCMVVQKYYTHNEKLIFYSRVILKSLFLAFIIMLALSVISYGVVSIIAFMLVLLGSMFLFTKSLKTKIIYGSDFIAGFFLIFCSSVYRLVGELVGIIKINLK